MILTRRRHFFRVAEFFLDEVTPLPEALRDQGVDVMEFRQFLHPNTYGRWSQSFTSILDLREPLDILWNHLDSNTRYDVRRAERDGVKWVDYDTPTDPTCQEFVDAYATLTHHRGLPPVTAETLAPLRDAGMLKFSSTTHSSFPRDVLTWHAYLVAGERVCLLHSVTVGREDVSDRSIGQLLGRANRLHHWRDIGHFHKLGYKLYDLGGWYAGSSDQRRLGINKFKAEFGGVVTPHYNGVHALSGKGRILVGLRRARRITSDRAPNDT
jgi:hypothetical protein